MKCRAVVLVLLLSTLVYTGALAANESGAASDQTTDSRLAQKISYEAKSKPLKTILTELSEKTGVRLVAGYNLKDWQVRDRRMNIYAKDITLGELMNSIAAVMKFKWGRNSDQDPPTYRLFMDRKSLAAEEAEVDQKEREKQAKADKGRAKWLDWIENGEKPNDLQLESIRESDPYRYLFYKRGTFDYFKALFKEAPGLKEGFLHPEYNMYFPVKSLSENTQKLLLNAVKDEILRTGYANGKGSDYLDYFSNILVSQGNATTEFVPRPYSFRVEARDWHFGGAGVNIAGQFFPMAEAEDPDDPRAKLGAKATLRQMERLEKDQQAIGKWTAYHEVRSEYPGLAAESDKLWDEDQGGEPVVEHADEPALHQKIKIEKFTGKLADFQIALAKAGGMNVVSDSFRSADRPTSMDEAEMELVTALESIAKGYYYNWEKHSSVIRFRSRNSFKYRASQVPDEWVDGWRERMIKNGYISLEDYAQIAWLTAEQLQENIASDEEFRRTNLRVGEDAEWDFIFNVQWLRFYALLSGSQRKLLFTDSGLPAGMLKPNQLDQVKVMQASVPDQTQFWSLPDEGYFRAQHSQTRESVNQCHFEAFDGDGKSLRKWNVTLPKYNKPKESEKPDKKAGDASK